MIHALVAALALGALMTFGDFVWEALRLSHRTVNGLVHGGLMCLFIGLAIGLRERRVLAGAAAGPAIGVLAAAGFYALAPMLGWVAMLPMWMLFWLCFALLQWQFGGRRAGRVAALRGLVAAILSGLAFWAISGIWTSPSPGVPDYPKHFLSWTAAFLPGFAALFTGRRPAGTRQDTIGRRF